MSEMTLDLTADNPTVSQLLQALSFDGTPWVRFTPQGWPSLPLEGVLQGVSRESGNGRQFILTIRTGFATVHHYVRAS